MSTVGKQKKYQVGCVENKWEGFFYDGQQGVWLVIYGRKVDK